MNLYLEEVENRVTGRCSGRHERHSFTFEVTDILHRDGRQNVQLLIVEFCNISDGTLEPGARLLLLDRREYITLDHSDIDTAQQAEIDQVLHRIAAHNLHDAARCGVVDDIRKILRNLHRGIISPGEHFDQPMIRQLLQFLSVGKLGIDVIRPA